MKKCLIENRHEEMGKNMERCLLCNKKIGKSIKQKLEEKTALISNKIKQKLIDLLHEGKTIGEAREEVGIKDLDVACEIINQNIGVYNFLRKEITTP